MQKADRLAWTVARYVADMPRGTVFVAAPSAIAGVRVSQELLGCQLALCGRGGGYDVRGILSLHARHWLFNQRPRAYITLPDVFETTSEPHALLATPAQVDGAGNANLSTIGDYRSPKVAFGGTRGLADARSVHFVIPLHNARQLVERVGFISSSVRSRSQPALLFTELAVMRWSAADSVWTLEAAASDTTPAEVQRRTDFRFEISPTLTSLEEPTPRVLHALDLIDPLGVRHLDFITDREAAWTTMQRIYREESVLVQQQLSSSWRQTQ